VLVPVLWRFREYGRAVKADALCVFGSWDWIRSANAYVCHCGTFGEKLSEEKEADFRCGCCDSWKPELLGHGNKQHWVLSVITQLHTNCDSFTDPERIVGWLNLCLRDLYPEPLNPVGMMDAITRYAGYMRAKKNKNIVDIKPSVMCRNYALKHKYAGNIYTVSGFMHKYMWQS